MSTWGLFSLFLLSVITSSKAALCSSVGCRVAECPGYFRQCSNTFEAQGNCSQSCKDAYYKLLGTSEGRNYLGCDCGNDSICNMTSQNFTNTCFNGSRPLPPPRPTLGPTLCTPTSVAIACNQDSTCAPLLTAYNSACRFAFQGINCSQQCRQSLSVVLQDPIGKRFEDPQCGCGSDAACVQISQNLMRACFSTNCTFDDVLPDCNSDTMCKLRLNAYEAACKYAFQGINCSQQCQQTFVQFLQDPIGNRATACHCAPQDTDCQSADQNLSRSCFNGTFPAITSQPTNQPTNQPTAKSTTTPSKAAASMSSLVAVIGLCVYALLQ